MKYNKNQRGETLIEVITALTALVMAGVAAVTVILSVMQANAISKEYLIAQNLAREGIEGVVKVRNSNWLKNPSNKTGCWLAIDPDNCATIVVNNGMYVLEIDTVSGKFKLTDRGTTALDLTAPGGESNTNNDKFKMKVATDGIYKQGDTILPAEMTDPPKPNFHRMIKFTQLTAGVSFKVTVTMQWFTKSQVNKYELTSIITNYAK